jgi:malonate-semialdehyde dehydrogenase (acetylating) / methylmalonate-semialdehyde dehydrogenase
VRAAAAAFPAWRATPVGDRIQPLFRLKALLERDLDELARTITLECGKTYAESEGELRRGIENVEVATGMPSLMQGYNNEDVARGIDEHLFRQPLGVVAGDHPFNFPGMIPLWFLPYAVAAGNCFVLKPSERVPMTTQHLVRLCEEAGFPAGVVSLVNGGKDTVDALLDHPRCARSPSSAARRSPSTSTRAPPPTASARSARAAPRTPPSCCPTPTST